MTNVDISPTFAPVGLPLPSTILVHIRIMLIFPCPLLTNVNKCREKEFIKSGPLAYSSPETNLAPKFDNGIQWSVNLQQ